MKKPIPFGKYYLLERINVGGMAEVFRAKAYGVEGFERLVAVKRILPNIAEDKDFIAMFVDEAKLAVQLNHANIAQIFDLGMVGSDYYIALEHIHGRDLRAIFERCRVDNKPMPIAQACFLIMKICEGLDYAHNKRDGSGNPLNLVHRDVSPQNILVSFEGEAKLIDFGIAKAAGKGSQTEAGILKGKFGYMSPEQVRGLPIDRRSDIFSCGIVLYELLTGERLFVGESDFSTLEKVRNVEILPPSTYNRRISDELERIVLKALAKDVDDRYQNAIDLHDELQAFVYTAGEFYSRKDLAGWMKQTFSKEIEEETAKLEAYRKVSPPEARPRARQPSVPPPVPAGRRKGPSTAPPPIPAQRRVTAPQRAQSAPPAPAHMHAAPTRAKKGLDWDEDELETSIYESNGGAPQVSAEVAQRSGETGQDLSALVQKARGWNDPNDTVEPEPPKKTPTGSNRTPNPLVRVEDEVGAQPPTEAPMTLPTEGGGPTSERMPRASSALPITGAPVRASSELPIPSSSQLATPQPQMPTNPSLPQGGGLPGQAPSFGNTSNPSSMAGPSWSAAHSQQAGFGMDLVDRRSESKVGLVAGIIAGVALLIGGIVAVVFMLRSGDETAGQQAAVDYSKTGFELHVKPADAEIWLNGKLRTTGAARITKLDPSKKYELTVKGPEGYMDETKTLVPAANEIQRMEIELRGQPVNVTFNSTPQGATVTLLSDGVSEELGPTPVTRPLDPSKSYRAMFMLRDGFPSIPKKIEFTDDRKPVQVAADFDKLASVLARGQASPTEEASNPAPAQAPAAVARVERPAPTRSSSDDRRARERRETAARERAERDAADRRRQEAEQRAEARKAEEARKAAARAAPAVSSETGTLALGAKPPCQIYIDGRNTGQKTPQRSINLPVGVHKVTLVNNEFGIRDTFNVRIEAGKRTKAIRDLSSKIQ